MVQATYKQLISRNEFGAIKVEKILSTEQLAQYKAALALCVKNGNIPAEYYRPSYRELECRTHSTYDIKIFRGRPSAAVIQVRTYEKNHRKNYTNITKSYFLIERDGRYKWKVTEIDSATCVKRAKNCDKLGILVDHYLGLNNVPCSAPKKRLETGYKILEEDDAGNLLSVFDTSRYEIGVWRKETAMKNHGGGFYYYSTADTAISAARRGTVFKNAWTAGKKLVLCKVEVAGGDIKYAAGKRAASKLRVIEKMDVDV